MHCPQPLPQRFHCHAHRCVTIVCLLVAFICLSGGSCGVSNPAPGNSDPVYVPAPGTGSHTGTGNGQQTQTGPTIHASDHVLGQASAPVTVIEYGDFQCPSCGAFDRQLWSTIKADYVDTGKVRFVFRHFPLTTIHDNALSAAMAAECAHDQVDFFDFKDMVYANQSTLFPESNAVPAGASLTRAELVTEMAGYVSSLGGIASTFSSCANADSKSSRVQNDFDSGLQLGVNSTPTFFVGSEKVVGASQLSTIIDLHLNGG